MMSERPKFQRVPPRWLKCPRKGKLIAGKFLPFKTPLSEDYDDDVPLQFRFTPSMLIDSLESYKVKMGLWIDLTNTNRFYDKKTVENFEIKYVKLACRGHGECPSPDEVRTFITICQQFISSNPLEAIGVHCTHGFNRTGYLISAFLVEIFSWSIDAAVNEFIQAREPGIYKEHYLRELFEQFGDVADAPKAPMLPDWCHEDTDDNVDDDGNAIEDSSEPQPKRRRKELNKKNPTFMIGVPGVTPITTQPKLLQIQRKCQKMCEWESSGFPGCQPISMDIENIALLQKKGYMVSWKADGTRYMMLLDGKNEVYFIDRDNCVFQVSGLTFPRRKDPENCVYDTLLDGEMIIDKDNGRDVPRYLIYDIIRFEGQEVGKADFPRRLVCIQREIIEARRDAMKNEKIDRRSEPFGIRAKEFYEAIYVKKILSDKFSQQLAHGVDGLIFQPKPDPYVAGRCDSVLKWKPPDQNSIDFKLKITTQNSEGMLKQQVGHLYVGGYDRPIAGIKVTKELRSMNNKIIECNLENGQWKFMRERTDKSFPNSYNTAMGVFNSICHPITKESLITFVETNKPGVPTTSKPKAPVPEK